MTEPDDMNRLESAWTNRMADEREEPPAQGGSGLAWAFWSLVAAAAILLCLALA